MSQVVGAALSSSQQDVPWSSVLGCPSAVVPMEDTCDLKQVPIEDIREAQCQDTGLQEVMEVLDGKLLENSFTSADAKALLRKRSQLLLKDGILCRKRPIRDVVLPKLIHDLAVEGCHDRMGHLGQDKTLGLLQDRFYWIGMSSAAISYVAKCGCCIRRKTLPNQRSPLVNITTTQPMELLCMDFHKVEPSKGGFENILVVTDHFTKYSLAFPCRNETAATTAKVLYENVFMHYGFPLRLHSNQGKNFVSSTINNLCDLAGIKKSHTTPYHAMDNVDNVPRFPRGSIQDCS